MQRPETSISYRPEIDGLRAVAVVPVILFHAGFKFFSGGFVGVDIFFVISGYLITAIIISEIAKGDFSLVRFYERRARRILPALFFVMACCLPFAWLWMDPSQYKAFSKSLIAVTLFGSNFLFWRETDYFAPDAGEKPLLHTWSLSVEEQFYLLFPLLLLLLWRFGRSRVLLTITVLAAASLVLSEFGSRYAPAANFYLAPTRAWELYAGAICAFTFDGSKSLISGRTKNLLSLAGLGMIAAAIILFNDETPVPSFYALVPVLGTCLIILFADTSTWTARCLATPVLVGIGLVSYSAYLWHQPLFAFARIRLLSDPSSSLMLSLAALSFILAYGTWRFVERYFRVGHALGHATPLVTRKQIFGMAAAAGCIFIAAGATTNNRNFYLSTLSDKAIYYANYLDYAKRSKNLTHWGAKCHVRDESYSVDSSCLHMETDKANYLLVGDSHAAHLSFAIREAFPGTNIMQATSAGCKPFVTHIGSVGCSKFFDSIFEDFLPGHKIDGLILAARWNPENSADLDATLKRLSKYVPRIIVLGPIIRYTSPLPEILRDIARFGEGDITELPPSYIDSSRYPANKIVRDLARKNGVEFVDLISTLCPNEKCHPLTENGEPMQFDRAHLTLPGSRSLVGRLVKSGNLKLDSDEDGQNSASRAKKKKTKLQGNHASP